MFSIFETATVCILWETINDDVVVVDDDDCIWHLCELSRSSRRDV